jgi:hypothetical protein
VVGGSARAKTPADKPDSVPAMEQRVDRVA